MSTIHRSGSLRLSVLAGAMAAAFGSGAALASELAEYVEPDSFVSFGIGNWSKDRPHTGIFDGASRGKAYGLIDAEIVKRDRATGTWLGLKASDLGVDPWYLRVDYLQQGVQGVSVEHRRLRRIDPNRIFTGLGGMGTATQIVSTNAAPLPFQTLQLGLKRDVTELGVYRNIVPGVDFNLTFKNDEKQGNRHWSRGGTGEFLAEPIDSSIRQLDAVLSFSGERVQLSGGYYGSWYRTNNTLVDSLRNGTNAAVLGNHNFMSLPLNNEAHQFYLNGGYSISPTTRVSMKVAYTRATQDERIPTADIPGLANAQAPRNLDGKVDTTLVQLRINSRPTADLSLLANLRYYDVNDKTPVRRIVFAGAGANVVPYSYTTNSGTLEATYRLPARFSVTGGVDLKRQDRYVPIVDGSETAQRKVPHRADIDEDTYRVQLRRVMSESVNGWVTYSRSKRTGSRFTLTDDAPRQDRINPIHIADRTRDKVGVNLDWAPIENFSVQFSASKSSDDYGSSLDRPLGVQKGSGETYSLDLAYRVNEDWQITGWVSHDESKARQRNDNRGVVGTLKEARLRDKGDSVGLGVRGSLMVPVKLGGDLEWTKTTSSFSETTPSIVANTTAPLPDVEAKLVRLSLFAEYAVRQDSDVRLDFIHERWRSNDWQWRFADGSPFVYGTTTDGTTVFAPSRHVSNFVGVRYIYKFQ